MKFNTVVTFINPSGLVEGTQELAFKDFNLSSGIPISQPGESALNVGFATIGIYSVVGALNALQEASGQASAGVTSLNGLTGAINLTSPSGSIKIVTIGQQIQLDVDLAQSGVPTSFAAELFPPAASYLVTHNLGNRNLILQVYNHNPYSDVSSRVIWDYEIITNNTVLLTSADGISASGYVVIHAGPRSPGLPV
jgi:hypothetical protein